MEEAKSVTVNSGTGSVEAEIYPEDTTEQIIALVIPELGLNLGGSYRLLHNGSEIHGDLYDRLEPGGRLFIAEVGGASCG